MKKTTCFKAAPHVAKTLPNGRPVHRTALKSLDQTGAVVDRDSLAIRGVTAMNIGEALGHYVWADSKTLDMTVEILRGKKLNSRFGHPAMSENSVGKKVGYGVNWRREGSSVRHDLQLMDAARKSPVYGQDPVEYILSMAETEPDQIGESFVVRHELAWLMADGTDAEYLYYDDDTPDGYPEHDENDPSRRPYNAVYPYPSIRPQAFYFVDIVNEGALTHGGLFQAGVAELFAGTSSQFTSDMFELIDQLVAAYKIPISDIPRKAQLFMATYLQMRGLSLGDVERSLLKETIMAKKQDIFSSAAFTEPAEDEVITAQAQDGASADNGDYGNEESDMNEFDALASAMADALGIEAIVSSLESLSAQVAELRAANAELSEIVATVAEEGTISASVPSIPVKIRKPPYAARLAAIGAGDAARPEGPPEGIVKPRPAATMTNQARLSTRGNRFNRLTGGGN